MEAEHEIALNKLERQIKALSDKRADLEKLNKTLLEDNIKVTKQLDQTRTKYLDMKTANLSLVASLQKQERQIAEGQGSTAQQEERAHQLAGQLEQMQMKHDVVLIQLKNLRQQQEDNSHAALSVSVEQLKSRVNELQAERDATLAAHKKLSEAHSKLLRTVEQMTEQREQEAQAQAQHVQAVNMAMAATDPTSDSAGARGVSSAYDEMRYHRALARMEAFGYHAPDEPDPFHMIEAALKSLEARFLAPPLLQSQRQPIPASEISRIWRQPALGHTHAVSPDKKGASKEPDAVVAHSFQGRGVSADIPAFLRYSGRLRNRYLSKQDVERIVKIVWMKKERERDKGPLDDFFYKYLKEEHGPSQVMVAEWGYNIVAALERFSYDADIDMFWKILMGLLPEITFVDQNLMLRHFQEALIKVDRHEHEGQQLGKVSRSRFIETLKECCPCKTAPRLEVLERALVHDCGGPGRVVSYIELFEDDSDGNQGHFVEAIRDQYLEEALEYSEALREAILYAAEGAAEGQLNANAYREAILRVDPKKPLGEVDDYVARGFDITPEEVEDLKESDRINANDFVKSLISGLLKRSTPPTS